MRNGEPPPAPPPPPPPPPAPIIDRKRTTKEHSVPVAFRIIRYSTSLSSTNTRGNTSSPFGNTCKPGCFWAVTATAVKCLSLTDTAHTNPWNTLYCKGSVSGGVNVTRPLHIHTPTYTAE